MLRPQKPWFFDEMRFGTRTVIGRRWTRCGHRPACPMKYGFCYNYLYQAVQPATGRAFEMFLPRMDGECFRLFLEGFSGLYPGQCLIMDNAGSHKTTLDTSLSGKVDIAYLSPYSPDFNPQERLFQEIKTTIKGKFFHQIAPMEEVVEKKVKALATNPEKVKKLTAWHWIV